MIRSFINHLLENEYHTSELRERIDDAVRNGAVSTPNGYLDLMTNDRNACSLRIGFLVGQALAIGMESDILTKVRSDFPGNITYAPNFSATMNGLYGPSNWTNGTSNGINGTSNGINGTSDGTNGNAFVNSEESTTESSEPNEGTGTDNPGDTTDEGETNDSTGVNGAGNADTHVAPHLNGVTNGH